MSWRCVALLGLVLDLVSCTAVAPSERSSSAMTALRGDGRLAELQWEATDAGGAVDKDHAIAAARAGIPATTSVEAGLAWLSVRGSDDDVLTLDRRKVWLVIFRDASFATGDACACEGAPSRPRTLVVIDASDGSVLAAFGIT